MSKNIIKTACENSGYRNVVLQEWLLINTTTATLQIVMAPRKVMWQAL